jgi:hypothetical protein
VLVFVVPLCELSLAVGALFYGACVTMEAFVFVSTTNPGPRAAVRAIRSLDGIVRADALFGGPPVVAIVQGDDLLALDAVIDRIVELPMVTDTETHVVRRIHEEGDGAAAAQDGASGSH